MEWPATWPLIVEDLSIGTITLVLLVALGWVAKALIRGDLITRGIHEETVTDRDYWRDLALRLDSQLDDIADGLRTTEHVVASLRTSREADEGQDDEPS